MFMIMMIAGLVGMRPAGATITDCRVPYQQLDALKNITPAPADLDAQRVRASAAVDRCEKERFGTASDCTKAQDDFKKTIDDYKRDCSAADMPTTGDTGAIACSAVADPSTTQRGRLACACADRTAAKTNLEACSKIRDEELKGCPAATEAAADRLAKEVKEAQDRVDKLRDKADKSDENQSNVEDKASEKASQARKAKSQAHQEYLKSMEAARAAKANAHQEMISSINGVQEKIFAVQQKLVESRQADAQAYTAFRKQQIEIDLNCTNQATQAVNQSASEAISHIKDGTYNRGSQNDLFRQVGITDRQSWQRQAAIRKKWCTDSENTHASQKSAEMAYNDSLKAQAAARQSAYDEISMLNTQMAEIQTPNGACTVQAASKGTVQSKACKDDEDYKAAQNLAKEIEDSAKKEANADMQDAQAAAQKAALAKMSKEGKSEAELNQAESRLKTLTDAEQATARYPYAGAKEPMIKKLAITGLQLFDQAGRVNRCCKVGQGGIDQQYCTAAKNHIEVHGITVDKLNLDVTAPQGNSRARREGDPPNP